MTEYLALNNNQLNQLAKSILLQEKQDADPRYLYSLQLARHVLEQQPELVAWPASKYSSQLALNLDILMGDAPETIQCLLLDPEMTELNGLEAEAENLVRRSGSRLPTVLVDNLYNNLRESVPTLQEPETSWE